MLPAILIVSVANLVVTAGLAYTANAAKHDLEEEIDEARSKANAQLSKIKEAIETFEF
jgi:hypothetical protein